jgi:hypothetical protein
MSYILISFEMLNVSSQPPIRFAGAGISEFVVGNGLISHNLIFQVGDFNVLSSIDIDGLI